MSPLSAITSHAIGMAYARLPVMAAVTGVLAMSYSLSASLIHHEPLWNVMLDSVSYFANTAVAWAVTRELRRSGHLLDLSRTEAVKRAEDLAQEREPVRHARILHDHALQTLQALANGPLLAGSVLPGHAAAEAARLCAL